MALTPSSRPPLDSFTKQAQWLPLAEFYVHPFGLFRYFFQNQE